MPMHSIIIYCTYRSSVWMFCFQLSHRLPTSWRKDSVIVLLCIVVTGFVHWYNEDNPRCLSTQFKYIVFVIIVTGKHPASNASYRRKVSSLLPRKMGQNLLLLRWFKYCWGFVAVEWFQSGCKWQLCGTKVVKAWRCFERSNQSVPWKLHINSRDSHDLVAIVGLWW